MDFFYLLFAHCLADFPLQGSWLAEMKGKEPLFLFAHVTIWTGFILLALQFLGISVFMWKLLFLLLGHYIADFTKCKIMNNNTLFDFEIRRLVYADQLFHLFQLLIVYIF